MSHTPGPDTLFLMPTLGPAVPKGPKVMFSWSRVACAIAFLGLVQFEARAGVIYSFSTSITESFIPGLPVGTPVSGTFSYDPAATKTSTCVNCAGYDTGTIQANFLGGSLSVPSGETFAANHTSIGLYFLVYNDIDYLELWGAASLSGLPAGPVITYATLFFIYPPGTLDPPDLPPLLPSSVVDGALLLYDGTNTAVGPVTYSPAPAIPEPSTLFLLGSVLATAALRRVLRGEKGWPKCASSPLQI
ncbi:MAG: PEP-CTERM sorting domain-containing protein [Candidatus Solibacter sp.]